MSKLIHFEKNSIIPASLQDVWAFHSSPEAFRKLTPPPVIGQVHRDDRESLTKGELDFTLWFGPIPIRWVAAHEPGSNATSFRDRMVRGPFASWVHEHLMEDGRGGVLLTDRISYSHKSGIPGLLSRLLFNRPALSIFFTYRHWITRRSVATMSNYQDPQSAEPQPGKNG